jgi:putative transposase
MKQHYPKIGMGQKCRLFGKSWQAYYELINRCNYHDLTTSIILHQVVAIRHILPKTGLIKLYKMLKPGFESEGIAIQVEIGFVLFCEAGIYR